MTGKTRQSGGPPQRPHAEDRGPWWYSIALSATVHAAALLGMVLCGALEPATQAPAVAFRQGRSAVVVGPVFARVDSPSRGPGPTVRESTGAAELPEPERLPARQESAPGPAGEPARERPAEPSPSLVEHTSPGTPLGEAVALARGNLLRFLEKVRGAARAIDRGIASLPPPARPAKEPKRRTAEPETPQPSVQHEVGVTTVSSARSGATAQEPPNQQALPPRLHDPGVESARPAARIAPVYPPASVRRGHEGLVVIEALVRADGTVAKARVVKSSSHRRLDQAAMQAVRNAHFHPATRAGRPVACKVRVPIRFRLTAASPWGRRAGRWVRRSRTIRALPDRRTPPATSPLSPTY
jgi:protein TonB